MDFILFGVVVNVMNGQRYEWILSSGVVVNLMNGQRYEWILSSLG